MSKFSERKEHFGGRWNAVGIAWQQLSELWTDQNRRDFEEMHFAVVAENANALMGELVELQGLFSRAKRLISSDD